MPRLLSRIFSRNSLLRLLISSRRLTRTNRRVAPVTQSTTQSTVQSTAQSTQTAMSRRLSRIISPNLSKPVYITKNDRCSICFSDITLTRPPFQNRCKCKATFCKHCIMSWLISTHYTCPTCRKRIFSDGTVRHIKNIYKIYSKNGTEPSEKAINELVKFFENVHRQMRNPRMQIRQSSIVITVPTYTHRRGIQL